MRINKNEFDVLEIDMIEIGSNKAILTMIYCIEMDIKQIEFYYQTNMINIVNIY